MAEASLESYSGLFGARSGGIFWSGRGHGDAYPRWEGEWTIAGMTNKGAFRALERFGDLAESGWVDREWGNAETDDIDPPVSVEPNWEDGHEGGMQVLYVDLLRDAG